MELIGKLLQYIANTSFLGIPLDIITHILVGALIFFFFRRKCFKRSWSYFFVVALAVQKELFDAHAIYLNQKYMEPVKDILVTVLGALILDLVFRNRLKGKPRRARKIENP